MPASARALALTGSIFGDVMARKNKSRIWPLALSPTGAAEALCIRLASVQRAIALGLVDARVYENRRVIITTESLIAWIKTWKRADRLRSYQKIAAKIKQREGVPS